MTKLTKKRLGMSHYENSKIRIRHLAVRQDLAKIVNVFGYLKGFCIQQNFETAFPKS